MSLYFTSCEFYTIESHSPLAPTSSVFRFCPFPLFFSLTISATVFPEPLDPCSVINLMDLFTICSYHKCFIFSMHRLKLDCVLAYSLCSSWSTSTPNCFLRLRSSFHKSAHRAHHFRGLPVSCLSSSFLQSYVLLFLLCFFISEIFLHPQKVLYAKFGKQIY